MSYEDTVSDVIEDLAELLENTRNAADDVTDPAVTEVLRELAHALDRAGGTADARMCALSAEWRDGKNFAAMYPHLLGQSPPDDAA